jgi:hypothetical protein
MITNLQIRNFRGFKDVSLKELRRINLLVGGNDTGKTSVLEAIILLLGRGDQVMELPITFRNNQNGGQPGGELDDRENFWPWLFYNRDWVNQIEITAVSEDGSRLIVKSKPVENLTLWRQPREGREERIMSLVPGSLDVPANPSPKDFHVSRLSVRPSHPVQDAEKYNQIALESQGEARFEGIMREVEPRLKRLRYARLPGTNSPLVFVDIGLSRAVPSTQMGQAFNRILHIYAEILTSKTNVLLIDEIENGIFSESLPLIWKGLFAVCEQQNVQIFATTHSRECVMAAYAAAHERGKDELSVQRLQIVKGNIEAVRMGAEHLEVASEMGLEVRS